MSAPTIELGQVCQLDRRTTAAAEAINRGLAFVGMEHVDPSTGRISVVHGSRTGDGKGQAFLFDKRHVLFGKLRPYLRKIAFPDKEGCSSTELVPLLPDQKRLDRAYLFHWVRQSQIINTLMAKNTGARMPRADMSVLLGMAIRLPPLVEQQRIVGLLDQAAEIGHRTAAARIKARAIIPALFLDTFGDPATNSKGWQILPFGEGVTSIDFGVSAVLSTGIEWTPEKVAVIRMPNISPTGDLITDDLRFLKVSAKKRSDLSLQTDDLIFNWRNSPKWIGKTTIWDGRMEAIFASFLYRIRVDQKKIIPVYIKTLFNILRANGFFESRVRQAVSQANFGRDELCSVNIGYPALALQTAFAEQVERVEAFVRLLDAAATKAKAMAEGLSAEVFS